MRSAQQLKDLGIPSWFHPHAWHYERLFTNVGWSDNQIDAALKFGANYQGDGSEAELTRQFRYFTATIGASDVDIVVDAGLGARDTIMDNGVEALPALPVVESSFTTADAARLAEIRQTIRDDPSALDRLQDEQLALLEAKQAAGGKVSASNANESAKPSGDRLAQIREMRRNDPSAYDRDTAMQAEELGLIEASLSTPAPVIAGNDGAASISQTEGTSSEASGD